ncbi:hypothetical protein PHYBOEH_002216 [Phytophthora boehmeriae]|uniref:M96 mating-specific protein family n=1 Tax=Phytophthora boehmeriae TaxID=109152 RepID=A0A8T1V322_9STRA|nr:hypothetical protein PHYBOEH_002216 [Phytophthora boehmeriae]
MDIAGACSIPAAYSGAGTSILDNHQMNERVSVDVDFHALNEFLRQYNPDELLNGLNESVAQVSSSDSCDDSVQAMTVDVGSESDSQSDRVANNVLDKWKKKPRAKLRRASPKEERDRLRSEVKKLSAKVRSLKDKSRQNAKNAAKTSSHGAAKGSSKSRQLWRRIALSQLERCHKAEAENMKLKEMVAVQILEAKNLRRILKRRSRIDMMKDMLCFKGIKNLPPVIPEDSLRMFEKMTKDLNDLYVGVNDRFLAKGIQDSDHSHHVEPDTIDGVYYEHLQKQLFPFSVQETQAAIWECLRQLGMSSVQDLKSVTGRLRMVPQHTDESEDTMRIDFFALTTGANSLLGVQTRKVVRRYFDAGRHVFICRMISEPKFENGHMGTRTTTTMQIIVENEASSDNETSVVKSYFTVSRQTPPNNKNPASEMTISLWDEMMRQFVSDIETILVDKSVDRCAPATQSLGMMM